MCAPYRLAVASLCASLLTSIAGAQIVIPGADGSDGALNVTASRSIDLAAAPTISVDQPNPNPGQGLGVYDPSRWAVVFRYSSVTINSGQTLTFQNHPSSAPVVWLVNGDVTITGTVDLSGRAGNGCSVSEPGPGGFHGASGYVTGAAGCDGRGPGGGSSLGSGYSAGGSHGGPGATLGSGSVSPPTYSNSFLVPLVGGSGGSQNSVANCYGGGAGGGAILIAATGTITINGSIVVSGGSGVGYGGIYWAGGGSGGAIRLLAQAVAGSGGLSAGSGGGVPGGVGRIAINANTVSYTGSATPVPLMFAPIVGDPIIWPPSTAPNIAVTSLQFGANVVSVPSDPRANWGFPTDASVDSVDPITLNIEATNVPLDWIVTVRIVPKDGDSFTVTAPPLSGTLEFSTTSITALTLPRGFGAVQARAARPTP